MTYFPSWYMSGIYIIQRNKLTMTQLTDRNRNKLKVYSLVAENLNNFFPAGLFTAITSTYNIIFLIINNTV